MKPVEGVRSTGATWLSLHALRRAAAGRCGLRQLRAAALRDQRARAPSVMGFVGAGGIGQDLLVAIRKFYYSDVSAILLLIIVTVFVIDIGTGMVARPPVRQGGAAHDAQLPTPTTSDLRGALSRASSTGLRSRAPRDAAPMLVACLAPCCVFGLVELDFSPARLLDRAAPARLDRRADAPARSRARRCRPICVGAGRDARRSRCSAPLLAAVLALAAQPAGGAQHRAVSVFCAFRCAAFSTRSAASTR